ncbi:YWFCY domain-containing protein, partial [uncultured Alistipes sp.]|uniref:YWFCY domain-containing protein n=1 Tax=uncultured Alistipes sp. TaxID=538949 RepID=UPI0026136BAF
MQQEDDLRGLAKTMEFMRAVSVLLVVINVYWYCYEAFAQAGLTWGTVDRILENFQRTAGLFASMLTTKLFAVVLLALSCLGTRGVKDERMTWRRIASAMLAGLMLFFLNWWILRLPLSPAKGAALYVVTTASGYILMLMAGLWASRMLRNDLLTDVFNTENESFMQQTRLMRNEYSVNLPTRFTYRGKQWQGWINVVNPFRATIVLGTPGSGKSYAVVNSYIRQMIAKGFAVYIY